MASSATINLKSSADAMQAIQIAARSDTTKRQGLQLLRNRHAKLSSRLGEIRRRNMLRLPIDMSPQEIYMAVEEIEQIQSAAENLFKAFSKTSPDRQVQKELNNIIAICDKYKAEMSQMGIRMIKQGQHLYPEILAIAKQTERLANRQIKTQAGALNPLKLVARAARKAGITAFDPK